MEQKLKDNRERNSKKRKLTLDPVVLVASLKDEPTFFYVPQSEYAKHKLLIRTVLGAETEHLSNEQAEKEWKVLYEDWYDGFTDFDDEIVEVANKNVSIVKVIKLLQH